ncbi:hypothetical protein L207DRAFT_580608 [Hyaloscypha variabilis F]|uniref:Uncharacterized protein n=1 Tax=Hyaloscypha variabilis (strain UAMH 11265 / GT02V1 / F) TaxID=1149755 RepID=A0A2J6RZ40_HYAVF|nr:hypothetical protein L207DRAFT_580608 [Hyaloscypha variabilis F]
MYHHAKFVLNESKLVKEEMEVINEWKAARLEELNFVGIVAALLASVITSIITGNVTLSWPIRALCLSALISVLISICIATQQTITLTRMCYDQRSVQEFRHALTKYERKARRTNSPQEGLEIRGGRQDNSSSKDSDDIEVGVRICRTEDTFDEPRKELEPSKLQVYVWQIPFMLLTISIILFIVGLNIWVFEAAVKELGWGDDRKVAVVFGATAVFVIANYGLSCVTRMRLVG